jgi:outer membrane receptor for ferrienterochelin and colicin
MLALGLSKPQHLGVNRFVYGLLVFGTLASAQSEVSFLHTSPIEAKANVALKVEGNLVADGLTKMALHYRGPNQSYTSQALELQYGDLYRGEIPAQALTPPGVEYFVDAFRDEKRVFLFATESKPVRVIVSGSTPTTFDEPKVPAKDAKTKPCKKGKSCKEKEAAVETPDEGVSQSATTLETNQPSKPSEEEKVAEPAVREAPPSRADAERKERKPLNEIDEEFAIYNADANSSISASVSPSRDLSGYRLDAAELKKLGARYVADALMFLPGVSVSRDVQGGYRIGVRGLRSDAEVSIYLNGRVLNNFYDAKALWQLPVDNFDYIELTLGPGPLNFALGNAQATLNLVTHRTEGVWVSGSAGLNEAFDGHVNAAKRFGTLLLAVDADVANQFGERKIIAKDSLDPSGTLRTKVSRDGRFLVNAGLLVSYENDALGTLSLEGRFITENRQALIGAFDTVGNNSRLGWQVIQAGLGYKKAVNDSVAISAKFDLDFQTTNRNWQLSPNNYQVRANDPLTLFPEGIVEQISTSSRVLRFEAKADLKLPANNDAVVGIDVSHGALTQFSYVANYAAVQNQHLDSLVRPDGLLLPTEDGKGGAGPAASRFNAGLFVSDTFSPVDAFSVVAGVRLDLLTLPKADVGGAWAQTALTATLSPRVAIVVKPTKALLFRAQYGRSVRPASPLEYSEPVLNSDSNQGRSIGNPNIQSATFDTVDVSSEYAQSLGDAQLSLRATGFYERVGNVIRSVDSTGNLVAYTNRALGLQLFGAEGEARLKTFGRAQVFVNASWVRAEDLSTPKTAQLLTDVPQIRLNAGASFPIGSFLNAEVMASYWSERRNNSRSVLELIRRYTLPAATVVSAQLRTELIFNVLELSVLGQNVFLTDYFDDAPRPDRTVAGVPREGLSFFLRAKVVFE